jgi:hypothetical protein
MDPYDYFQVHMYSSDNTNLYDNTLSSFTNNLEAGIKVQDDEELEVAFQHCAFNKVYNNEEEAHLQDVITLGEKMNPPKSYTLEEFAKLVVHSSLAPKLYDRNYFGKWLNPHVTFNDSILGSYNFRQYNVYNNLTHDNVMNVEPIKIKFLISDYLKDDELFSTYFPKTDYTMNAYASQDFFLKAHCFPLTLNQIIFNLVKGICKYMRELTLTIVKLEKKPLLTLHIISQFAFLRGIEPVKKMEEVAKLRNTHLAKCSVIFRRFLEKFLGLIEKEVAEMESKKNQNLSSKYEIHLPIRSKYVFVYLDAVAEQYVGSQRARVITNFPLESSVFSNNYIYYKEQTPIYLKIEKKNLTRLSIEIRDERGNRLDIASGTTPTLVSLCFRKRKKLI